MGSQELLIMKWKAFKSYHPLLLLYSLLWLSLSLLFIIIIIGMIILVVSTGAGSVEQS